jgi:hypothetical protein
MEISASLLFGFAGLTNPVTPWVVLVVCAAVWLALYVMLTARSG